MKYYLLHQYRDGNNEVGFSGYASHRYVRLRDEQRVQDYLNTSERVVSAIPESEWRESPGLHQVDCSHEAEGNP